MRCNYPGTEGTVVEYHWDAPVITNNGYIARNPSRKLIIVSFRGSAVLGDWVEDFTESPVYWPESVAGSTVVLGVLGGYLVSSKHILQGTAKLAEAYPDYAIVAVGHSLGGSRASMFVADFVLRHPQYAARVQMYTYGQAKSGNRAFADFMNGLGVPIYRAVNRGDIVPHLPLTDTRLVHFGTEVWTTLSNRIVACPNTDYSRCSNSLPLPAYSTSDHSTYFGL
ncbi:hypothetical protein GGF46_000597 [Coemansia sp. RSA 552]|nr:hypothetical protein GGF46_000597 [Coemansia sp. RSA 552]